MCPGIRLLAKNQRNWDQIPISLDGFSDLNLDLRLSAASIKISDAQLGRTAVAAGMRDGKFDLTIGEVASVRRCRQGLARLRCAPATASR